MELKDNLKIRNFSKETIKSYNYYLTKFQSFIKTRLNIINTENVNQFLLTLNSPSSRRIALAAIKQNYPSINIEFPSIKRSKPLPRTLSKQEVISLINSASNLKHKLLIEFLYSTGLRLSEVQKAKFQDVNYENNTFIVRKGKGDKARLTILSPQLTAKIKSLENLSQSRYIFISNRDKPYSKKTIQKILENAAKHAKLNKKVTPHMLRHSFATHLLEQGTDIQYIQKLLGHQRLETTQIYTHVASTDLAKIKNPLDNL